MADPTPVSLVKIPLPLRTRAESALTRAGDGTKFPALLVRLLSETLDQLETDNADIGALPTVVRIRKQLGRATLDPGAVSDALASIEARLTQIEATAKAPAKPAPQKPRKP